MLACLLTDMYGVTNTLIRVSLERMLAMAIKMMPTKISLRLNSSLAMSKHMM
ncbi:hypothetical protein D3C87_1950540 [compost metagenome]